MKSLPLPISWMPLSAPASETLVNPKRLAYACQRSCSFFLRMKRLKFKPQLTFSECLKLRVLKGISTVAVQPSDVMRASEVQTPSHPGSKSPPVLRSPCSSTMRPSICVPKGLILKHVGSATVEVRVDHDCKM